LTVEKDGFMPYQTFVSIMNETNPISVYLAEGLELLFESFENPTEFPPLGWLNFDLDGDGYFWRLENLGPDAYHGTSSINSESFCWDSTVDACLYPDNWIITRELEIPEHTNTVLSFAVKAAGSYPNNEETFSVYVITSPITDQESLEDMLNDPAEDGFNIDFPQWDHGQLDVEHGEELMYVQTNSNNWIPLTANLNAYRGETVRIAFRHWHSWNNLYLNLDAIRVSYRYITEVDVAGVVRTDFPAGFADGAVVTLTNEEENTYVTVELEEADEGEFTFESQIVGDHHTLTIALDGYHTYVREWTTLPSDDEGTLDLGNITLKKYFEITGTLVGPATINATVELEGVEYVVPALTGITGAFTIPNVVSGGPYTLKVRTTHETVVYGIDRNDITVNGADLALGNITLSVSDSDFVRPNITTLHGNYPNPFNPTTTIAFELSQDAIATIEIFNIKGQKVATLVDGELEAGRHNVIWEGVDSHGREVGSGIYFYRMTTEGYSATQKMILMK
jgi:hypothetical protein